MFSTAIWLEKCSWRSRHCWTSRPSQVPQDRAAVSSVLVAQAWQGFPLVIRTGMTAPRLASAGPAGDVAGHVFAAAGCAVPEGAVVDDAQRAAHLPAGGAVGGVLRQELASEGLQAHGDVGVQGAQRWSKSRWCRCPVQSDAFGARHSCQAEAGCRPGLGHFLGSSGGRPRGVTALQRADDVCERAVSAISGCRLVVMFSPLCEVVSVRLWLSRGLVTREPESVSRASV